MFDISVDQFFYPDMGADAACKKRINVMLNSMEEKDLRLVEALIRTIKTKGNGGNVKDVTSVFHGL